MHGYATATGLSWTIQRHTNTYIQCPHVSSGVGSGAKKSAKQGGKKKKVSLRPEYDRDHPGDAEAVLT